MKIRYTFMLSALAIATLATAPWLPSALAQQGTTSGSSTPYQGTTPQQGIGSQHGQTQQDQSQQGRGDGQDAVVASAFTAQVTGRVTSVDPQSGKLSLETPDGQVNVRFPPPAVAHVKTGDTVTVAVGLMEQSPAASPSTGAGSGMPSGSAQGQSSGTPSQGQSSGTK